MIVKQIHLSQSAKEQLSRLKGKTGIQHWNILCRWALCISLAEPSTPPVVDLGPDSNVEMSWQVFGGEYQEIYEALLKERCFQDGLSIDTETLQHQFRLHLHRGISYMAAPNYVKTISSLINLSRHEPSPASDLRYVDSDRFSSD